VALVGEDTALSTRVPQLQVGVRAARGQEVSVGMEIYRRGGSSMASQSANQSAKREAGVVRKEFFRCRR